MGSLGTSFSFDVFINCPFDSEYQPLLDAMVFAIMLAGFRPRCAREVSNFAQVRLDKLMKIIGECKYGIHDISRTELDKKNGLPRFNMPLELGIDLGCRQFGKKKYSQKVLLVLDRERFRYQKFISDLAGQDPASHGDDPKQVIIKVRDWLSCNSQNVSIPGGSYIHGQYELFKEDLPELQKRLKLDRALNYRDYVDAVRTWLDAAGA